MLTAGSPDLQVVLAGDLLQLGLVGGQLRHLDVHGRAHGGAQVGRAERQKSEPVVVRERQTLFDIVNGSHQTAVDLAQVASHLHGDDAKMVLLVAPDQEGLSVVVVDTTAGRPETASVGGLQEAIALLEQEVVVDQLLLDVLAHPGQGVERSLQLALQAGEGGRDLLFHLLVLLLGQAGVEGVALEGAAAAHAGGHDELVVGVEVAEHAHVTPVLRGVLVGLLEATMVVLDDGVEEIGENCVGFGIGSVNTDSGVVVFISWKENTNIT